MKILIALATCLATTPASAGFMFTFEGTPGSNVISYTLSGTDTAGSAATGSIVDFTNPLEPFQFSEFSVAVSGTAQFANLTASTSQPITTFSFFDSSPDLLRFSTASSFSFSGGDVFELSGTGTFTLGSATFDDFTTGTFDLTQTGPWAAGDHELVIQQAAAVPEPPAVVILAACVVCLYCMCRRPVVHAV